MSAELEKALLERHSLDDLIDIYVLNDRKSWQVEVFPTIEKILRDAGREIPEQVSPEFNHSFFFEMRWFDVRENILENLDFPPKPFDFSKELFLVAARLSRIVYFLVPLLLVGIVSSIGRLKTLEEGLILAAWTLGYIAFGVLLYFLPDIAIKELSTKQLCEILLRSRFIKKTRFHNEIASKALAGVGKISLLPQHGYSYVMIAFFCAYYFPLSPTVLSRAQDLFERNGEEFYSDDTILWAVGWLYFMSENYLKASELFARIHTVDIRSSISELVDYCRIKARAAELSRPTNIST